MAPALPAASCWSDFCAIVQTRSLALHNVAAAKGTRFARVTVIAMYEPQKLLGCPFCHSTGFVLNVCFIRDKPWLSWNLICKPGWSWKSEIHLLRLGLKVWLKLALGVEVGETRPQFSWICLGTWYSTKATIEFKTVLTYRLKYRVESNLCGLCALDNILH